MGATNHSHTHHVNSFQHLELLRKYFNPVDSVVACSMTRSLTPLAVYQRTLGFIFRDYAKDSNSKDVPRIWNDTDIPRRLRLISEH